MDMIATTFDIACSLRGMETAFRGSAPSSNDHKWNSTLGAGSGRFRRVLGRRRYGPKMLHDEPNHSAPDRAYSENRGPGLRDDGRRSAEQQTKEQTHRPTGPCQPSDADDKSNRKSIEKGCGQSGALIWKGM